MEAELSETVVLKMRVVWSLDGGGGRWSVDGCDVVDGELESVAEVAYHGVLGSELSAAEVIDAEDGAWGCGRVAGEGRG